MSDDPLATRRALRRRMREARSRIDSDRLRSAARLLAERVCALDEFARAARVAGYLAINGEMDPCNCLERALAQGKDCYVPVIAGKNLLFARWTHDAELRENRLGIGEPVVAQSELLRPRQLDLVLVPLVAFDAAGNRVGMGGGFYDRSFARSGGDARRPVLIGVAHESQRVAHVEVESWDVPLDAVVTEAGVYRATDAADRA